MSTLKKHKLSILIQWLGLSQKLVNEHDSDAVEILSKLSIKEMRVIQTLIRGAFAKGYRDATKDFKESNKQAA